MSDIRSKIDAIRQQMLQELEAGKASHLPIFIKNWLRYETCVLFLLREVPNIEQLQICDYGCGHPFVLRILKDLGLNVIGFEPYATEDEWKTARILGVDSIYKTSNDSATTFDLVVLIDVIEHISIPSFFMRDMQKLMAKGGYFFVSTPNVLRIDQYYKFVMRQTGHPNPIDIFSTMENNYQHHQREFTMAELKYLFRVYQFKFVKGYIRKTIDRNAIRRYHGVTSKSLSGRLFEWFKDILIRLFPNQFANNILFLARENFKS